MLKLNFWHNANTSMGHWSKNGYKAKIVHEVDLHKNNGKGKVTKIAPKIVMEQKT